MKSSAIVCAIAAASLGLGSLAQAQGFDRRDAGEDRHEERYDQRHDARRVTHREEPRFDQRKERSNDRRDEYNARGPEFHRGGYIPNEYRRHEYVVVDYRAHRLPPPPHQHQWVQVGADYALIAIATGLIASVVLGH